MLNADNSIVSDEISPKFKLIHTFMYVLVTYKIEEDQMKNECARMSSHYTAIYFRHSRAANFIVGGPMWPKIKLIKALIVVLDTCENDEDLSIEK